MKNVRKTIVIVAAISVITPFVTLTAAPDSPSTRFAPRALVRKIAGAIKY